MKWQLNYWLYGRLLCLAGTTRVSLQVVTICPLYLSDCVVSEKSSTVMLVALMVHNTSVLV
jgi:hypothetical protein